MVRSLSGVSKGRLNTMSELRLDAKRLYSRRGARLTSPIMGSMSGFATPVRNHDRQVR